MCTGALDYFPRAFAYLSRISVLGNDKHNPGEPLHWAEGKSMDHPDCIMRHLAERGEFDTDDGALHAGKLFWRAGALLETVLREREAAGEPIWDEAIIATNREKVKANLAQAAGLSKAKTGYGLHHKGEASFDEALGAYRVTRPLSGESTEVNIMPKQWPGQHSHWGFRTEDNRYLVDGILMPPDFVLPGAARNKR